ncbi:MAG TPA: chemotaxis protein CheW [Polyangia bacterium]|jgi:purine-binding chemotaxis protein CheW|nr:chemotaxis protein CheW [Polyangia bacterium]
MATTPALVRQYVTFNLMGEEYALHIEHVREIIECERITAIPSMPLVVRGVMNLRGNVVPVVDLPVKFGLPETSLTRAGYLVVVELTWNGESVRLGLLTTELGRVIDVKREDIKPVPDFGTRIQSEYLRGVGQIDGRFVLFLDSEHLLSPAEILKITALENPQPQENSGARETAGEQAGGGA